MRVDGIEAHKTNEPEKSRQKLERNVREGTMTAVPTAIKMPAPDEGSSSEGGREAAGGCEQCLNWPWKER